MTSRFHLPSRGFIAIALSSALHLLFFAAIEITQHKKTVEQVELQSISVRLFPPKTREVASIESHLSGEPAENRNEFPQATETTEQPPNLLPLEEIKMDGIEPFEPQPGSSGTFSEDEKIPTVPENPLSEKREEMEQTVPGQEEKSEAVEPKERERGQSGDIPLENIEVKGILAIPPYPEKARKRGYEGVVKLRLTIAINGRVSQVEILESTAHTILTESCRQTVLRKWRFAPREREVTTTKTFRFQLK